MSFKLLRHCTRPSSCFSSLIRKPASTNRYCISVPGKSFVSPPSLCSRRTFGTAFPQWQKFFDNIKKGSTLDISNDLKNGFDVNYREPENLATPLIMAATHNQVEVMKILIQKGAKINFQDTDGDTALIMAARNNHFDAVKLLLESGAQANVSNFVDVDAATVTDKERIEALIEQYEKQK